MTRTRETSVHESERPGPSAPVLLSAEDVSRIYADGQVRALDDVSLQVRTGEYLAVMGHSGSGKSTLLNLLGAIDRPSSGEIYFDGQPYSQIRHLSRLRSQAIGFVFQAFYLLPALSAAENIQMPMFETSLPVRERRHKAQELLHLLGIQHRANHRPEQLSMGERQRVAIARALANDPLVLLADEPTGNLDSVDATGIFNLFDRLRHERGITILLVTHNAELATRAERLVSMRDGRIYSDGLAFDNTHS